MTLPDCSNDSRHSFLRRNHVIPVGLNQAELWPWFPGDMLAANRTPILAYHFAWPGIGHVAKQGDGFRYYPEPMNMVL